MSAAVELNAMRRRYSHWDLGFGQIAFRHLSPTAFFKRDALTVNLTVNKSVCSRATSFTVNRGGPLGSVVPNRESPLALYWAGLPIDEFGQPW